MFTSRWSRPLTDPFLLFHMIISCGRKRDTSRRRRVLVLKNVSTAVSYVVPELLSFRLREFGIIFIHRTLGRQPTASWPQLWLVVCCKCAAASAAARLLSVADVWNISWLPPCMEPLVGAETTLCLSFSLSLGQGGRQRKSWKRWLFSLTNCSWCNMINCSS